MKLKEKDSDRFKFQENKYIEKIFYLYEYK